MEERPGNGWEKWGIHVLEEQKRQAKVLDKLLEDQKDISVEIGMIKVKATILGLVAGAIPGLVTTVFFLFKYVLK